MKELEEVFELVKEKTANITERHRLWIQSEEKISSDLHPEDLLYFLVGGEEFSISRKHILDFGNSYFYCLIRDDLWKPDESGYYNIDRSPTYFSLILDYLRFKNKSLLFSGLNKFQKNALKTEMDYFQLIELSSNVLDSEILMDEDDALESLLSWMEPVITDEKQFNLLFRASRDGFDAIKFRTNCNNKGPTLTIIVSSTGDIFGGYTSNSWNGNTNNYVNDNSSFIFTLKNKHNIKPTKYICNYPQYGIYDNSSYGPCFGGGFDICIYDKANTSTSNYTNFPHSYTDSTGVGRETLTTYNFTVRDYEVFNFVGY